VLAIDPFAMSSFAFMKITQYFSFSVSLAYSHSPSLYFMITPSNPFIFERSHILLISVFRPFRFSFESI